MQFSYPFSRRGPGSTCAEAKKRCRHNPAALGFPEKTIWYILSDYLSPGILLNQL